MLIGLAGGEVRVGHKEERAGVKASGSAAGVAETQRPEPALTASRAYKLVLDGPRCRTMKAQLYLATVAGEGQRGRRTCTLNLCLLLCCWFCVLRCWDGLCIVDIAGHPVGEEATETALVLAVVDERMVLERRRWSTIIEGKRVECAEGKEPCCSLAAISRRALHHMRTTLVAKVPAYMAAWRLVHGQTSRHGALVEEVRVEGGQPDKIAGQHAGDVTTIVAVAHSDGASASVRALLYSWPFRCSLAEERETGPRHMDVERLRCAVALSRHTDRLCHGVEREGRWWGGDMRSTRH